MQAILCKPAIVLCSHCSALRPGVHGCGAVQVRNQYAEIAVIALSVLWAMYASVPFLAGTVGDRRRWLAVYPIALMFAILGWLIFIS